MMKIFLMCLALLFSSNCLAIDVEPIKKGDPAPSTGFFVSQSEMKKLRKINEEKKLLQQENLKLKDLQISYKRRLELEREYSSTLNKRLANERLSGVFKGMGGFLLGTLLTGLASYATIKTIK